MGHRHLSNTLQLFEIDQDRNQSHITAEQSYIHTGRAVTPEYSSFVYPMGNIQTSGPYCASQSNLESRPIEHSSSSFRLEGPQVRASLSGPSYDSYPHFPAGGSFYPVPESNASHSHSNNYSRNIIHEVESGLVDHTMGTGRVPFKRKRLNISVASEGGSPNGFHGAGSSSNSFEIQSEKSTLDYQNYPSSSIVLPHYRGPNLSIGSPRNTRIQSRLDVELSPRRTYLSNYSSYHHGSTTHLPNHSRSADFTCINADASAYDQNHVAVSSAAHGRFQTSGNTGLRHEMNPYLVGGSSVDDQNHVAVSSAAHGRFQTSGNTGLRHEMNQVFVGGSTTEISRNGHDSISSRNPVFPPRYLHDFQAQCVREGRSNYSRRAIPSHRTGLSLPRLGQGAAPSEYRPQFISESSSRYSRSFSARGWHNNHRGVRSRVAIERFQSPSYTVDEHERMGSEALMTVDRSLLYGSRNMFDQYGDMRLDIDSMSYEELLALGERMGNVSTGLSTDVILKCLMETTYSSDKNQEEAICAICLEEYKNNEEIGAVKNCGHDYHSSCIKKWLLMKNTCPICKAPALADSSKEE